MKFIILIACLQKYNSAHFVDKYLFFKNPYESQNKVSISKYLIFKNRYGILNLISKNKIAYLIKRYKAEFVYFYAILYIIKIYLIIDINFDLSKLSSGIIRFKKIKLKRLHPFEIFGVFCGIFEIFNLLCYFIFKPSNILIGINYGYSVIYIYLYIHSFSKIYIDYNAKKNNFPNISFGDDNNLNDSCIISIIKDFALIAIKTLFIY